jgi:hypothetical protein
MTEHKKKWHPVRDATKSVIWKIRLLFQRETDAFHCFTNGSFVNVITCHGSYTTLQINSDGLHTFDSTDDFLGIGAAMVASHAFDMEEGGLLLLFLPRNGEMFVRTERVCMTMTMTVMVVVAIIVMVVSTRACRLMLQFHAEHIEEEEGEDGCTCPFEPARHFMTAGMGAVQMVGEPLARQEVVDAKAEEDGTSHDGCKIEHECFLA